METQQPDGVVVDVAGLWQGSAKLLREREVLQGRREAPKAWMLLPSLPPTIYRAKGEGEGAALPLPPRKGAAKGGRSPSSPRHLGGAFPL